MARRTINFVDKSLANPGLTFLNNINAATLGQVNQLLQAAGVTIPMGGQDDLGKRLIVMEQDAADWTLAANGTLFGGIYQIVQVDSGAVAANVGVGKAAFWKRSATGGAVGSGDVGYVVTDESTADNVNLFCGVFLNSILPGNFGAICVGGKVNALFRAVLTGVAAIGGNVVIAGLGTGVFDMQLVATAVTFGNIVSLVGKQVVAAVGGASSPIYIKDILGRY